MILSFIIWLLSLFVFVLAVVFVGRLLARE